MVRTVVLGAGADLADALAVEFVEGLAQGYRLHFVSFIYRWKKDKTSKEREIYW